MTSRTKDRLGLERPATYGSALGAFALFVAIGCSGEDSSSAGSATGGSSLGTGGTVPAAGGSAPLGSTPLASGGATATGVGGGALGGQGVVVTAGGATSVATTTVTGGAATSVGGAVSLGGTATAGGSKAAGGATSSAGGMTSKGGATSTTTQGGATSAGGAPSAGGATAKGGATSAGGAPSAGGTSAAGGSTAACAFPTTFKWSSSGVLAEPKSPAGHNFVALKDFTYVFHNNQHLVYATVFDSTADNWSSVFMKFDDWSQMATAPQTWMGNLTVGGTVAPELLYFTPKKTWVLITQWGLRYATSSDPTNPASWTKTTNMLTNGPSSQIDPTFICTSSTCYLFWAGDNGNIYRSSMPIGNFPGTFNGYQTILTDTQANLFEAVEVYSVTGTGKYLMIVEAMGSGGRFFRAFSATDPGGTWTVIPGAGTEATPFAGKKNVTFTGTAWTNDISHGDLIRSDPNETKPVDPCKMQMLYQGRNPAINVDYGLLPYRPGLLTKTN